MSLSRSKSSSDASGQDKGKGKEKENEESVVAAVNEEKVAGPLVSRSFSEAPPPPPPQLPLIFLQDKELDLAALDDNYSPPPSIPSLSRAASRASVTEPATEKPSASGSFQQPAVEAAAAAVAGPVVDDQTAVKSWSGFAVFRAAEALASAGAKRLLCGSCFGYCD